MDRTERVELTTLVMLCDGKGRILLEDRIDPDWGGLCFPGGHVEPGESIVRAAVREFHEETGLTLSGVRLCGIKQFPIKGGRYLVFLFRADSFTGILHSSAEGEVGWYRRSEISPERASDKFAELLCVFDDESLSEMYWQEDGEEWKLSLL